MDEGDYLALKPDAERQLRYKKIARFLSGYDYPSSKVPDLDKIVPLPPAKLPKWDGKIEFLSVGMKERLQLSLATS